jgi:hypothetical protein
VNALFELQEVIPYLMSISVICSFAYICFSCMPAAAIREWAIVRIVWTPVKKLKRRAFGSVEIHRRLVRKVKRKEASDEDSADCSASFDDKHLIKRGGFIWRKAVHSITLDGFVFR